MVVDTKRTLEPRLLRPPLQLLKPPSVGSWQGMLGAQGVQDSLISTEPPREPVLSRSPLPMMTWAPPRLEPQTPPERMLLPEKVTLPRERVELEPRGSGPHTRPPRELLTAAGGRDRSSVRLHGLHAPSVGWEVRALGGGGPYCLHSQYPLLLLLSG